MSKNRTTKEVFESHLILRKEGKVEDDISQNYSKDSMIISDVGNFKGHKGIRESAKKLEQDVGNSKFKYLKQVVVDNIAYLIWQAEKNNEIVAMGSDSFLIEDNKIKIQTIYYEVK